MRIVENQIQIIETPNKVISAFTDLDLLAGWWAVERALVVKQVGGTYTLAWAISDSGFGYISSGLITEYIPDQKLVIDKMIYLNPEKPILGPMKLSILVEPFRNGSQLTVKQEGYQEGADWDWYYHAVREAWPSVLKNLKSFLENRKEP